MLKGHLKVQLSKDEELTLHNTVPQLPELPIQFQWFTIRVKIPGSKKKNTSELIYMDSETTQLPITPLLPVTDIDDISSPEMLLFHFACEVDGRHGH